MGVLQRDRPARIAQYTAARATQTSNGNPETRMNLPHFPTPPRHRTVHDRAGLPLWRLAALAWAASLSAAVLAQPVGSAAAPASGPASTVGTSAIATPAPYTEVQRLLQAGQYPQALAQAQAWLEQQAGDPQMRFLKGVVHSRMGDATLAADTFTRLTQDYPELPEPYNNLAVLHAQQNRLDEARAALDMAIRLNPGYAVAHQNLGDVYARMAAQSYTKALQLSPDNAALQPKLQALENALGKPR